MPAAAMAVPAIISAGGSVAGGILGSSASKKAAKQQADSANQAIDLTNKAYSEGKTGIAQGTTDANQTLNDSLAQILQMYSPYKQAGEGSLSTLQELANSGPLTEKFQFNPTDLQNDPGYAFSLAEGQKALQRSAAAKGGLFSTGTMKAMAGYTTGTANQYFNDAFNRAQSTFDTNRSTALSRIGTLQGLANLGYGATGAGASATGNTAQQVAGNTTRSAENIANLGTRQGDVLSDLVTRKGTAQSAGTMGAANAWSGAIGGATNAINSYLTARNVQNSGKVGANATPQKSRVPGAAIDSSWNPYLNMTDFSALPA